MKLDWRIYNWSELTNDILMEKDTPQWLKDAAFNIDNSLNNYNNDCYNYSPYRKIT